MEKRNPTLGAGAGGVMAGAVAMIVKVLGGG